MKKLETLCLKRAMALGQISPSTRSEDLPDSLIKKMRKIQLINGEFLTQDNVDIISMINMNYDGEDMIFEIESRSRSIRFKFKSEVPILLDHRLMDGCLGDIDSNTKLDLNVKLNNTFVVVEISAEESKWKWSLRFQIMLVFQRNLGYL